MPADKFRPIFVVSTLEQAVLDSLEAWFSTYLRQVEFLLDRPVGVLPTPRHYTRRNKFDALPGEETPRCVAISPGLVDAPVKDGNGIYRARWGIGVGIAVNASDEAEAQTLAELYGATIRAIIMHQGVDLPNIWNIEWRDESYDDLPLVDQILFYKAAAEYFIFEVNDVLTKGAGPLVPEPSFTPPDAWGTVETVDIDTEVVND